MARAKMYQQPNRLAERMKEAGVTHDAVVRADIIGAHTARASLVTEGGRLATKAAGPVHLHFCGMPEGNGFLVRDVLKDGDGGPVTENVFICERLRRAIGQLQPWTHLNIRNAIVSSNGQTRVFVDDKTRLEVVQIKDQEVHEVLTV